jgi:hypothetical protein
MPESGVILRSLLTFIFPVPPVLPPSVEETMELLSVAQKYEMNYILIHIRGSIALQDPPFLSKNNALHIYSLAQKYGLHQEVLQSARLTLKFSLTIENLEGKLDVMPGDHLHELWEFHQRFREKLLSNVDEFKGSDAYRALTGLNCADCNSSGIPNWIDEYINSIAIAPSSFNLFGFQSALAWHVSAENKGKLCSFCTRLPEEPIDKFWAAFTAFLHGNMEEVNKARVLHVL